MGGISLRAKLLLIFGTLLFLFVFYVGYSIMTTISFSSLTNRIYEHPLQVSNSSLQILNNILRMQKTMKEIFIVKDEQQIFIKRELLTTYETYALQHFAIVKSRIIGHEGQQLAKEAETLFRSWRPLRNKVISLVMEGKKKEGMNISRVKYQSFMLILEEKVNELHRFARNEADNYIEESLDIKEKNINNSIIYGLFILTVCFVLSILFGGDLLKKLGADPKRLSDVAESISKGDTNIDFGKDELSGVYKVLNQMVEVLESSRKNDENRKWLRRGLVGLDDKIRGINDLHGMTESIITHVAEHTGSLIGSLYILEGNRELVLFAGYAPDPDIRINSRINFGEGLVGHVAKTGKEISFKEVPVDYLHITSSIGETLPKDIYIVPLKYEGSVVGVMELARDTLYTDEDKEFIDRIAGNIGVSLNMAKSRQKVNELLERTQQQAQELQQQQEELRVSNEELEEQTKLLQESEKRLQQQQEELRVTNEELEERSKAIEKQRDDIKEQNSMLENAQNEIIKKAEALEEASRYKSEFLANMSHELRTPLNSILILSQLLSGDKKGNLSDKQKEFASTIYKSGNNLLSLINDILDLSKIEAGRFDIDVEETDLREMLKEIEAEISPLAEDKNIYMKLEFEDILPEYIKTDGSKLSQVLKNLLSNAVKFTEKGGVTVRAEIMEESLTISDVCFQEGELISISVTDTGMGIPEDKIDHIFEAFTQVDGTTSRKFGGTGLGLSICRKICEMLGGKIEVTSKVGEGSTFTVILPMRNSQSSLEKIVKDAPSKIMEEIAEIKSSNEILVEEKKMVVPEDIADDSLNSDNMLLIIEDDKDFVNILRDIAEEKGFDTLVASDGEKGLFLADYHKPKAIILDVSLPGIDGFEVMKRLKENSDTKSIPVHFISASDMTMKAMHMGAIGFLTKPVTTEGLDDAFLKIESVIQKQVKKLLIVEDNDVQRQSIVELIGNGDVVSTAVATGEEAYKILLKEDFDCMILDLGLEDMDGMQFLNRIKENDNIKDIPVIIYTGKDLTHEEDRALQQYAGSIIVKGARSPERLLAETSLFLHRVEKNLPDAKRRMLKMSDRESVLENKKILIVDDDMRNVFALTNVLEENGMKVEMAENGKEGVEKALGIDDIDLVLMDIMMPVMDGYEAIREIRKDDRGAKIPVIALTAKAMQSDRVKCIEAGANEYMSKPVNIDKLISLLRVWLYK